MKLIFKLSVPLLAGLMSCNPGEPFVYMDGGVWNTTYSIQYRGDAVLADSVLEIFGGIEMSLSPFNENSVISRVNRNDSMAVDSNIERVFGISKEVNAISGGAFDPTLSPLINLWGFGYAGSEAVVPDDSIIASAMAMVGMDECRIENGLMCKKNEGTTFNFSAVTKGYGCDEIARMFRRNGVTDYMIEIGGEIALGGLNPRGKRWRVMIDAPEDTVAGHKGLLTVELTDCGVATSGNYRNFRDTGSGRMGHTLSPVTGRPVSSGTLSATVIAPECALADALATACMAMRPDSALAMITCLDGVDCLLVIGSPDSIDIVSTQTFPL